MKHTQKLLIESSENGRWSITRAFLKCRNEELLTHDQIVVNLRQELEQYMSYYSSVCDDDMTEQFQKYEDEGICSDACSDVIIQGLSNSFKVNIMIYCSDEKAACCFISKEKNCVFPTGNNYVEDTVSMLKENNVYHALQDIPGKYKT